MKWLHLFLLVGISVMLLTMHCRLMAFLWTIWTTLNLAPELWDHRYEVMLKKKSKLKKKFFSRSVFPSDYVLACGLNDQVSRISYPATDRTADLHRGHVLSCTSPAIGMPLRLTRRVATSTACVLPARSPNARGAPQRGGARRRDGGTVDREPRTRAGPPPPQASPPRRRGARGERSAEIESSSAPAAAPRALSSLPRVVVMSSSVTPMPPDGDDNRLNDNDDDEGDVVGWASSFSEGLDAF